MKETGNRMRKEATNCEKTFVKLYLLKGCFPKHTHTHTRRHTHADTHTQEKVLL